MGDWLKVCKFKIVLCSGLSKPLGEITKLMAIIATITELANITGQKESSQLILTEIGQGPVDLPTEINKIQKLFKFEWKLNSILAYFNFRKLLYKGGISLRELKKNLTTAKTKIAV